MDRVAIMLRTRKDIHDRIADAAKEVDKPITRWVMDAIMEKLPVAKMAHGKSKSESAEPENTFMGKMQLAESLKPRILEVLKEQGGWVTIAELIEIIADGSITASDYLRAGLLLYNRGEGKILMHHIGNAPAEEAKFKIREI